MALIHLLIFFGGFMATNSPIFIGCIPRTGASLLRNMIGSHPNIFGGNGFETNWFSHEVLNDWQNPSTKRQVWLRDWYGVSYADYINIQKKSTSGVEFFSNFMKFCMMKENKKRWIEKTPGNILHLELIKTAWPSSKLVHAIRDLRDVFASWKHNSTGQLLNNDVFDFVRLVTESYNSLGNLLGTQTNNYYEVKYEDLVLNTEKTLRKVFNFLDEEWVNGLENYFGTKGELEKVQNIIGKGSTTSKALAKPIFSDSIGRRSLITTEELRIIDSELGDFQFRLGYLK